MAFIAVKHNAVIMPACLISTVNFLNNVFILVVFLRLLSSTLTDKIMNGYVKSMPVSFFFADSMSFLISEWTDNMSATAGFTIIVL